MKVLMFSGDPRTVIPGNEIYERMRQYGGALGDLKILVLSGKNILRRFFALWSLWWQGVKILRDTRYDAITVQAADDVGLVGYLLSRKFGVPLQVQIHTDVFSPWYRRAGWKERARYYLARFLVPKASCIRVVSERIRESIISNFQFPIFKKIIVLPIFTDVSKFLNAKPDPAIEMQFRDYDFKIVSIGRLVDKEKNFSMLIDVMRDFVKVCPRALLVLVGDGPDKSSYQLLITKYNLENNVILKSWRDDLPSFYKSFDLYLMSSNYEGWGRTVIEAMASGLPVVMTDVGLAGEVVKNGENGTVVSVGDKKALLEAVADLYKDSEKRLRFARAGQEAARNLKPGIKDEYLVLYRESFGGCAGGL